MVTPRGYGRTLGPSPASFPRKRESTRSTSPMLLRRSVAILPDSVYRLLAIGESKKLKC